MTSVLMYLRIYSSTRLLKSQLKQEIFKSFWIKNTNIRYINSIKREPILKTNSSHCTSERNISRFFRRTTKEELKIKDDIPDQYILIYRSKMERYIFYSVFAMTVSAVILTVTTLFNDFSQLQIDFSSWATPPRQTENEVLIFVGAFITILVTLQLIVSRLPIRIYNLPQQKKYILVFSGNLPFTKRKVSCKVGDIIQLPEKGIMPWRYDRYLLKNEQTVILIENYFRRSADLYIMLGVQRDSSVDEDN